MNMLKTWRTGIPILAASLLMLLGTACQALGGTSPTAATSPLAVDPPAAAPTSPVAVSPLAASAPMGSFSTAVRQVTQQVEPAVVQITNEQVQVDMFTGNPFTVPAGVGSGVIYDNQGHILTNNHVVEGAQTLLVSLPDGRSFKGKLIGADPQTDLAVVQISGSNLPVAELGDSRQLQVGDWLVAIGNALALPGGPTVTAGVVSALDRTVQEPGSSIGQTGPFLFDVIQTDAPINPGNSGGPLVNLDGQVVGINTLVAGQAEPGVQAQGIGFAIAIATAKPIADQLVATGHVVHASMGVSYVPLNSAIAIQLGITAQQGVVVTDVSPGSPAADAGLQPQDVITAINDQPLNTESALAQIVNSHQPGDTLTLTVIRGTQQLTLQVTLVAAPSP
jgi:S1-C subfamily serine protease